MCNPRSTSDYVDPLRCSIFSRRYNKGFALLEFLVVVTVIGILMGVALNHFTQLAREAEKVALKAMARNFSSSMTMLRNKWIVEGELLDKQGRRSVLLEQDQIFLNQSGWPVSTDISAGDSDSQQTAERCAQLWRVIMQSDIPATVEGQGQQGEQRYHISLPEKERCRYALARQRESYVYFDYVLTTGKVELHGE